MAMAYGYQGPDWAKLRPRNYPRGQCSACGMVISGEYAHRKSGIKVNSCDGCDGTPLSVFNLIRFMEEGR